LLRRGFETASSGSSFTPFNVTVNVTGSSSPSPSLSIFRALTAGVSGKYTLEAVSVVLDVDVVLDADVD